VFASLFPSGHCLHRIICTSCSLFMDPPQAESSDDHSEMPVPAAAAPSDGAAASAGLSSDDGDAEADAEPETGKPPPVCIILGMAGSGKTSVMQRVASVLAARSQPAYHINLDPAVSQVPFGANIDICDTVNYREVMKQYGLGPNGAIMTSLNLFATRFEEVLQLLEKRAPSLDYIFVDTPGQIEVFTWSASGDIITKMLGATFPTVLIYVVDTTRCTNATTFMCVASEVCNLVGCRRRRGRRRCCHVAEPQSCFKLLLERALV
jgi:hypothetical protein